MDWGGGGCLSLSSAESSRENKGEHLTGEPKVSNGRVQHHLAIIQCYTLFSNQQDSMGPNVKCYLISEDFN